MKVKLTKLFHPIISKLTTENGGRGTHFAKFSISLFQWGLTHSALYCRFVTFVLQLSPNRFSSLCTWNGGYTFVPNPSSAVKLLNHRTQRSVATQYVHWALEQHFFFQPQFTVVPLYTAQCSSIQDALGFAYLKFVTFFTPTHFEA